MATANVAHAEVKRLVSVPSNSEEVGYLVIRKDEVEKFYSSVQQEVIQLFNTAKKGSVYFVFIPPRVSERLAENNFRLLRTDRKKMKRPEVLVGEGHSLVLIRKYTLMV